MFSILTTFGVILPPLAAVCCFAVLSATWNMQLFMGRFIVNANQVAGASGLAQLVDEDTKHAAWMFLDSIWMLAPFCVRKKRWLVWWDALVSRNRLGRSKRRLLPGLV